MAEPIKFDAATIDEVHALFAALIAFMGDRWVNASVSAFKEPNGAAVSCTLNASDAAGNSVTHTERIVAPPSPAKAA